MSSWSAPKPIHLCARIGKSSRRDDCVKCAYCIPTLSYMDGHAFNPDDGSASALLDHQHAIEQLAEDSGQPTPLVAKVYWSELARLKKDAKVDTYLGLLTRRRVKEALRA